MIKVGLRLTDTPRDRLQLAAQLGVDGAKLMLHGFPGVAETGHPDPVGFRSLLQDFDDFGLEFWGMQLGLREIAGALRGDFERGERELPVILESMRMLGDHGIDLVTVGFGIAHADEFEVKPNEWGDTWRGYTFEPTGRGGALVRSFDAANLTAENLVSWGKEDPARPGVLVSKAEYWRRMDFLMERLLPVAREAGLRIALHPNDPPLPVYRGVEQPFNTPEGLDEMLQRYDEPNVGLIFCLGTMQESGADMPAALRRFGQAGKLFLIHFRNVRGTVPRYQEVFQDEGDYDSVAQMRTLHEVGYDGYVMPDHYPLLTGDNQNHDMARAWCVGYLRALIQATAP